MLDPAQYRERYQQFCRRLQEARRKAGLTQVAASTRLGKPQSFISKCEAGERRIDYVELLVLCDLYGVEPEFFKV